MQTQTKEAVTADQDNRMKDSYQILSVFTQAVNPCPYLPCFVIDREQIHLGEGDDILGERLLLTP